jgi:hypothetical protein
MSHLIFLNIQCQRIMIDYQSLSTTVEWSRFCENGLSYTDNNPYMNSIIIISVNCHRLFIDS